MSIQERLDQIGANPAQQSAYDQNEDTGQSMTQVHVVLPLVSRVESGGQIDRQDEPVRL